MVQWIKKSIAVLEDLVSILATTKCVFSRSYGGKNKMKPVANTMKVLQAGIYKSQNTGLFLHSLVATNIFNFNILMRVFAF